MGVNQDEVAERSGLTRQAISHYENARRLPGIRELTALARGMAVSADRLLGIDRHRKYEADIAKTLRSLPMEDRRLIRKIISRFTKTKRGAK
jgi:transcriptional regulator with XRE-family HTH domain